MRCPHCGAWNKDGADWCNQCFRTLVEPDIPAPSTVPIPVVEHEPADPDPPTASPGWTCPVCEAVNPIIDDRCGTCGTPMVVAFTPSEHERDEAVIRRWSTIPGGGHMKAGAGPIGGAILLVVLMAHGFGWALVSAPATRAIGMLLLAFGVAAWVLSAHDVHRHLATGARWIFQPRVISGMAGGIVVLLFVAVLLAI